MTHPHMTKFCRKDLLEGLEKFERLVDSHDVNNFLNEDAIQVIFHMTTVLKHEIELIAVEER